MAHKNNGIVVCKDPKEIREKALGYGITGLTIWSFYEYIVSENPDNQPIYLLNINDFIEYYEPEVKGYSLTLEDLK